MNIAMTTQVADIEAAEKQKMREKVQKIIAHGINYFVNRQLIYNFPEELFADAGILAIEHADFEGIERLALVTGGEIASTFDNPESVKTVRTPHLQSSPKHLELLFRVDINAAHYSTLPPLVGEMPHPSICGARTASTPSTMPLWAPQRPHPPALQWKEERAGRRMTR